MIYRRLIVFKNEADDFTKRTSDSFQAKIGIGAALFVTHYAAFFAGSLSHSADWGDLQQRAANFLATAFVAAGIGWSFSEKRFAKRFEDLKYHNDLIKEELDIVKITSERLEEEVGECTRDRADLNLKMIEMVKETAELRNLIDRRTGGHGQSQA